MKPKADRRIAPWRERADQQLGRDLKRREIYLLIASTSVGAIAALVAGVPTLVGAYQAHLSKKQLELSREQTIQATRPFVDFVPYTETLFRKSANGSVDLIYKYVNFGHGPAVNFRTASYLLPLRATDPPQIVMPKLMDIDDNIPPNEGFYPASIRIDEFFQVNKYLFESKNYIPILRLDYNYLDIYGNSYFGSECYVIYYDYKHSAPYSLESCASLFPKDRSGKLIYSQSESAVGP